LGRNIRIRNVQIAQLPSKQMLVLLFCGGIQMNRPTKRVLILQDLILRQDEGIKLEYTREATLIAHNIHLNLIEVDAVHGLLPTMHAGAVLLEAPRIIF
jgi:hypothetical protein